MLCPFCAHEIDGKLGLGLFSRTADGNSSPRPAGSQPDASATHGLGTTAGREPAGRLCYPLGSGPTASREPADRLCYAQGSGPTARREPAGRFGYPLGSGPTAGREPAGRFCYPPDSVADQPAGRRY